MKNILVLRFSAMGDVAMAIPVVMSVLDKYDDIKIFFATQKLFFPLFPNHERLFLIEADIKGRHKTFLGLLALLRLFHKHHIYKVADLHNVLRTKIIALAFMLMGIKVAALNKQRKARKRLLKYHDITLTPTIAKYVAVFAKIGYPITLLQTPFQILPKYDQNYMIGFAPFASFKSKELETAVSVDIVMNILKEYPSANVYLLGGKIDDAKMQLFSHHPRLHYLHTFTLRQQIQYINKMDVLISMDSANMHIASLCGIPVISIWCGTSPSAGFLGFRQSIHNAVVANSVPCMPCSIFGTQQCRNNHWKCTQISAIRVMQKINEKLQFV